MSSLTGQVGLGSVLGAILATSFYLGHILLTIFEFSIVPTLGSTLAQIKWLAGLCSSYGICTFRKRAQLQVAVAKRKIK